MKYLLWALLALEASKSPGHRRAKDVRHAARHTPRWGDTMFLSISPETVLRPHVLHYRIARVRVTTTAAVPPASPSSSRAAGAARWPRPSSPSSAAAPSPSRRRGRAPRRWPWQTRRLTRARATLCHLKEEDGLRHVAPHFEGRRNLKLYMVLINLALNGFLGFCWLTRTVTKWVLDRPPPSGR